MKSDVSLSHRKRNSALTLIIILTAFLLALYFILPRVNYFSLDESVLRNYFPQKWALIGHLAGGMTALLLGPFQFYSNFRNRYLKVHRTIGKIYLIAILLGAISSIFLSFGVSMATHWTWAFSLQMLAMVWIVTAFMAYRNIRLKRIEQHRQWMVRSYLTTFGFAAFRYLNDYSFLADVGTFVERAPTIVWFVWAIPLFFADVIFSWNRK